MFRGESMRKYKISLLSMSAVLLVSQVAYASSKDLEVKKQQMTEKRDEVSQEIKEKKEMLMKHKVKYQQFKERLMR